MDQFLVEYAEKINKVLESGLLLKEISKDNADLVAQKIQDIKGNARPLDHMFGKDNNRIFLPFQGQIGEELRKLERKIENLASDEINVDVGRGLILKTIETRVGPKETELKIGKFLAKSIDDVAKLIEDFQALEGGSETQRAKTTEQIRRRIERLSKDWSNGAFEWEKHSANPQSASATFYSNIEKIFIKYLETWNAHSSARADATIIVTRHPMDILRMADHAAWKSCHSEDRGYFSCVIAEVEEDAGAVAYIVKNQDLQKIEGLDKQWDEIFVDWNRKIEGIAPSARLRLRTFQHDKTNQYLAIPEDSVYTSHEKGIPNFFSTVKVWTQEAQMSAISEIFWSGPDDVYEIDLKEFTLMGGDYVDRGDNPAAVRAIFGEYFDRAKVEGEVKKSEGSLEAVVFDRMERLRKDLKNYIYQWHNVEDVPNSPRVIKIGLLSKIDFEKRGFSLVDPEQSQDKAVWESIYSSTFRARYSINLTAKHELSDGVYHTEDEFEDTASLRNLTKLEMSIRDLDEKYDELVNKFITRLSNANLIKKAPEEKEVEKQGQKSDMLSMFGKGPAPKPDNSEEEVITEISRGVAANIAHKIQDIVERDRPLDFMFGKGINRLLVSADLENPELTKMAENIKRVVHRSSKVDVEKGVVRSAIETQRGPKEVEQKIGKVLTRGIAQLEKIKSNLEQEVGSEQLKADTLDRYDKLEKDWNLLEIIPLGNLRGAIDARMSEISSTSKKGTDSRYLLSLFTRAIGHLKLLLDDWVHQAGALSSSTMLLITRHPMDIVRMSDHSAWTSCHAEGNGYFHCVIEEVEDDAGALAYIIKSSDAEDLSKLSSQELQWGEVFVDKSRNIEGITPAARIRMRTFQHEDSGTYLVLPEDSTHSPLRHNVPGLFEFMKDWTTSKQEDQFEEIFGTSDLEYIDEISVSDFRLMGGSYVDRGNDEAALSLIFEEFFEHSEVKSNNFEEMLRDGISDLRSNMKNYRIRDWSVDDDGYEVQITLHLSCEKEFSKTDYTLPEEEYASEDFSDNSDQWKEYWQDLNGTDFGEVGLEHEAAFKKSSHFSSEIFKFESTLATPASTDNVIDILAGAQMLDNDFNENFNNFLEDLEENEWIQKKKKKSLKFEPKHFRKFENEDSDNPAVIYKAPFVVDFLNVSRRWQANNDFDALSFANTTLTDVLADHLNRYAARAKWPGDEVPELFLGKEGEIPPEKKIDYHQIKNYVRRNVYLQIDFTKGRPGENKELPLRGSIHSSAGYVGMGKHTGQAFFELPLAIVIGDGTGQYPSIFSLILRVLDDDFEQVVEEVRKIYKAANLANLKSLQHAFTKLPKTKEEWEEWDDVAPTIARNRTREDMISKSNGVTWAEIEGIRNKFGSLISK